MTKLEKLLDQDCDHAIQSSKANSGHRQESVSTLCYLYRHAGKRRHGELRFSGYAASGDWLNHPPTIVIDIGRAFVITVEWHLCLTGEGPQQIQEFTPAGLLRSAKSEWFGFKVLWDEREEETEEGAE